MKKVSNLRSLVQAFFMVVGTINFFIIMDVVYSSIASLTYSAIHNLPTDLTITLALCLNLIACFMGTALAGKLVINKQASNKTMHCFSIMFALLLLIVAETYDVYFSKKLGMEKSLLLNFPAENWVFGFLAFAGIGLQIPFAILYHKIIHVKGASEENVQIKEQDADQR